MFIRCTLALIFSMMLGLTSQSMAVARGASAATGQMILCTGSGPTAVYMDASGKPTSAPHLCPDSALNVIVGFAISPVVPPADLLVVEPFTALSRRMVPALPDLVPPSRGPPVSV